MTNGPIREQEILHAFESLASERGLALAVSGGSDSVALMLLVRHWRTMLGSSAPTTMVLTVDHGLRTESSREAAWVGRAAGAFGFEHATLAWEGSKPASGLQVAARRARYDLLSTYCQVRDIGGLVTAHQLDDQAETLLMRLGRGSGVDGLAAIPRQGLWAGIRIHRPLLDFPKSRLIETLEAAEQGWLEDPSNRRQDFERNRVRKVLDRLEEFGFTRASLALTARRMRRAQEALDHNAGQFLAAAATLDDAGFVTLNFEAFRAAPEETAVRGLGRALMAVGGSSEPPRLGRLEALAAGLRNGEGQARTLAGCRVAPEGSQIRLLREPGRDGLPEILVRPGRSGLWDRRFRVSAPGVKETLTVRALGRQRYAELRKRLEARSAMPSDVASGLVSFWRDRELVAVPHLGFRSEVVDAASEMPEVFTAEFVNGALLGPEFDPQFAAEKSV